MHESALLELQTEPKAALILQPDKELLTLGIETSCDETSVSVLRGRNEVLSNIVSSQAHLHERYGGVVPEIAARAQLEAINPALEEAIATAQVSFWDLDVVAVVLGPGLVGSLLVGVAAAKSLAAVIQSSLVGVNHLEAHLYSCFLEHPDLEPPAVGLIVSGGHTMVVHMLDHGNYEILGETLDDAAGEAFDKIARFLGLGYPGGPPIDSAAIRGDAKAIAFPRPMIGVGYDSSFSGLKTAVINHVERSKAQGHAPSLEDICASFQEAIVDVLVDKVIRAALETEVANVLLCGGVAANSRLRRRLEDACKQRALVLVSPSLVLCTDNAAMVARCGYERHLRGLGTTLAAVADPNLAMVGDFKDTG